MTTPGLVASRLELADLSAGEISLSDHAARSIMRLDGFSARLRHPSPFRMGKRKWRLSRLLRRSTHRRAYEGLASRSHDPDPICCAADRMPQGCGASRGLEPKPHWLIATIFDMVPLRKIEGSSAS
jgi:hypothetical protein